MNRRKNGALTPSQRCSPTLLHCSVAVSRRHDGGWSLYLPNRTQSEALCLSRFVSAGYRLSSGSLAAARFDWLSPLIDHVSDWLHRSSVNSRATVYAAQPLRLGLPDRAAAGRRGRSARCVLHDWHLILPTSG